jgi:hypothetical protein
MQSNQEIDRIGRPRRDGPTGAKAGLIATAINTQSGIVPEADNVYQPSRNLGFSVD